MIAPEAEVPVQSICLLTYLHIKMTKRKSMKSELLTYVRVLQFIFIASKTYMYGFHLDMP
jgi:hypothetical protein